MSTAQPRTAPTARAAPGRAAVRAAPAWREYLIEAWGLGTFMVSACVFATLLEHPASPVRAVLDDALARRALMGTAMGLTALSIAYSPWGRRSGAHLNPALTWTFFRLGRVAPRDAVLYTAAQFAGGILGVLVAGTALGALLGHPSVRFVTTVPGAAGPAAAFAAEVVISMGLALVVLSTAASARLSPYTPVFAGLLIATYITVEAPISGMSMNPARTFGSALAARDASALWLYFTAPPLGMLLAAQLHLARRGRRAVPCAKLRHVASDPCIFCDYAGPPAAP